MSGQANAGNEKQRVIATTAAGLALTAAATALGGVTAARSHFKVSLAGRASSHACCAPPPRGPPLAPQ